jgi:putative phosphoesterase
MAIFAIKFVYWHGTNLFIFVFFNDRIQWIIEIQKKLVSVNSFVLWQDYSLSFLNILLYSCQSPGIRGDIYSVMKLNIGILSDTHLSSVNDAFEKIYDQHLADKDIIIHAGDFVSVEIVAFLGSHNEFHGVCGNMDPYDIREMLPEKKIIDAGPFKIGIMHGWGAKQGLEDRLINVFSGVDIIVYGHSHRVANHSKDGVLFFNGGTATGHSLTAPSSIGILEIDHDVKGRIINV